MRFFTRFLFITLSFCLWQNLNAQTVTISASGTAGSLKTGSVSSTGTKSDDAMITINSGANRGWAAFDLSSIPSTAHVTAANIVFTTYTSTGSTAANNLYGFVGNPATMAGTTLYTNIVGTALATAASWTANATNTKAMTTAGIAYLNNNRSNANFNVGYVRASMNNYNVYGYGASAANKPQLVITYATTAAVPICAATPSPANAATAITAGNFSWGNVTNATNFKIYVGTDGGGTATPTNLANGVVTNGTTFSLATIPANSTIYWQIKPTNGAGEATGCTIWNFATAGAPNCATVPIPADAATNIQRNPTLTWTAPSAPSASSYDVYFGTSTTPPLVGNQTTTSYTPALLSASATYYWKVVPKNALGDATGCATWSFTTGTNIVYCTPAYGSLGCTDGDVIATVTLNTLSNNSGAGCPGGATGYSDYTSNPALTTTLQAGATYTCSVLAGQYNESYAAWVDYNDDGVFSHPSERVGITSTAAVGSGTAGVVGTTPGTFPITLACNPPLGTHRMRFRCAFSTAGSALTPCGLFTYGEAEDYLITIAAADPCPAPSVGLSSSVTNNQAVLTWTTGCAEMAWDVHVTTAGGGAPTGTASDPGVTKPFTKTGLTGLTAYEYWVRAICTPGSLYSNWAGPFTFTTLADPPTCATGLIPANLATNAAAPITTISWTAPTGPVATSYAVYFGTTPNPVSIGSTANTFVNITGLTVATTYYWRVEPSNSGGGATGCVEQSFTTAATTCDAPTAVTATNIGLTTADVTFTSTGTNFILEYGATGFVPGTGTTAGAGTVVTGTASPISLTGLTVSTNYQVYIRTDCGSGTVSANSTVLAFSTGKVNDLCSGAIALPAVASDSLTGWAARVNLFPGATGVTGGLPAAACVTGGALQAQDVWYSFVAPSNVATDMFIIENACVNVAAASVSADWNIAIYDACGGALIGCNEDSGTGNGGCSTFVGRVTFCPGVLTAGTTYYVRTAPYSATATAGAIFTFTKASTCLVPPANNDFASATDIQSNIAAVGVACTAITAQTTVGATTQAAAGQSSCGTFDNYNDVWYKFNSGLTLMNLRMDVTNVTATKTVKYALYKVPTVGSLTNIMQHRQGVSTGTGVCGSATSTTVGEAHFTGLEQNQNYYVRVWSTSAANAGAFDVCFTDETPAPAAIVAATNAAGTCSGVLTIIFNASNNMVWVPVMDGSSLVCMINANGNNMGSTTVKYYRNTSGTIRTDGNQVYGDRNFEVTPTTQPTTPASVRIYMTQAEWDALAVANPSITYSNFGITRVSNGGVICTGAYNAPTGSTTTLINGGVGTQDPFGAGSGVQLQYNTPGFSTFFVNGVLAPLPITLKSFSATEKGNVNVINWETETEQNVRNFVVEKSQNGLSWSVLNTTTPNASKRYGMTDNNPFATTYYRLKNMDNDGRFEYSNIVVVERQTGKFNITSVAPNPTSNDLTVKFETIDNVEVAINVLDIFGKVVLTQQVDAVKGINSTVVNTSNLPAGAYFLNVNNGVNTLTQRIVKQ